MTAHAVAGHHQPGIAFAQVFKQSARLQHHAQRHQSVIADGDERWSSRKPPATVERAHQKVEIEPACDEWTEDMLAGLIAFVTRTCQDHACRTIAFAQPGAHMY